VLTGGQLLGRESEMAALHAVVAAGVEHGSALLVIGEPGIGKSALLSAARAAAGSAGYTVLRATGTESEIHLPFGGIHQTLAPLMCHLDTLPPAQRQALATAFGLAEGTTPDLFLIAEAALALLTRERSERAVIIVVDDVHWLDPQSHQILAFLAHRGARAGVCVIGAIRSGHTGPFADAGFPQLVLAGVDDETANRLLSVHAGGLTAADQRRIRIEARGNPLALLELPRSWGDGPPTDEHPVTVSARLEHAFAGRIAELPQGTRDALLVAAAGSSSDMKEILAALQAFGTPAAADELLGPAVAAGLVVDDHTQVVFRHPLVRSGVLQRETLSRRHAAHAALADVLLDDTYRRAWHRAWSIVGPDDDIADALAATVPDSLRRGAAMSAAASLERSAQLTSSSQQRGHRLIQAADQAFGAGRADVVSRILREAARVDLSDLDASRLAWLAEALNDDVRADPALVRKLCSAARRADDLGDMGLALNLLVAAALRCWWADSGPDDRAAVVRVLDGMDMARSDPRHITALSIAEPVLRGSEVTRTLAAVDFDAVRDGDSLRVYGIAAYAVGDFVLATDLLDRAEESFRSDGRLGMLPVVLALQLQIRLDLGDWSGAVAAGEEVVTISRDTGQDVYAVNNVLVEARGTALRGDWQAALEVMAEAESDATRLRINDRICLSYQARGTALLCANRPAEAFDCLRRQYDSADPGYHLRESFAGLALTVQAAVECGRAAEARAITRAMATVAVITPSPLLEVNLLYASAVLAPAGERETPLQAALDYDLSRWPWMRARVQLAYGDSAASNGRPAEAAPHLQAALAVFTSIGALRWRRSAERALANLDGSSSGSPGSGTGRTS
jgi:tetratricopeptide (TPR) repeat protein